MLEDPGQLKLLKRMMDKGQSKYRNEKTVVNGIKFDSKKESDRWKELRLLEMCGEIKDLIRQKRFEISVNGRHICDWISDFSYSKKADSARSGCQSWDRVVEDVKSPITRKNPVYALKKKLILAIYGIKIKEV